MMNFHKNQMSVWVGGVLSFLLLGITSCTTPPILPSGTSGVDPVTGAVLPCPEGVVSFEYEILPLMIANCAYSGCHDAATAEEGVVLDSYANIMKEVKAGKPNKSELYKVLIDGEDDIMPPPPYAPFNSAQIALVKTWIEQGAQETTCGDGCVPEQASFAADIYPTLQRYCIGCHNTNSLQGNVNLESYEDILIYVDNGQLTGTIEHLNGYNPMPPSGKLTDCRITQIQNWIDAGAQNN